jgi:DMSO/TMAO reductase YedYZ molybdopterin-dependent catalytic subunit
VTTGLRTRDQPAPTTDRPRPVVLGAVLGIVTAGMATGVAHLVAGIVNPEADPVVTVGQAAIDASPEWLKSFAIRTFGSNDKTALLIGIGTVLLAIAVALGIAGAAGRWKVAAAGLLGLGILGVVTALSRPAGDVADAVPALIGTGAAAATFAALRAPLTAGDDAGPTTVASPPGPVDRRRFLVTAGAGVVVAAVAGGAGRLLARRFRADASRAAVRIPTPAGVGATPGGVNLDVPGLPPFITPNDRFYRVDTAILVPSLTAEDWRLRVHGMVDREIELTYAQLVARPLIERDITLTCVSNEVGGPYAGNARWVGAPLRDLLEDAGVHAGADQIVSRSIDGFTAGTPTGVAMDGRDAMLAVSMNGEPLPLAHGFPVRMVVPGLYGYVSATKWVVDLELTTFRSVAAYWVQRYWSDHGPIKTESRIDTPTSGAQLRAGPVPVAGVAWAQHTGIDGVQLRVDGGTWIEARLAVEDTIDTWRQWVVPWNATAGDHTLEVRAIDRSGAVQTADRTDPFPDGATGHHTIVVRVV